MMLFPVELDDTQYPAQQHKVTRKENVPQGPAKGAIRSSSSGWNIVFLTKMLQNKMLEFPGDGAAQR